MPDTIYKRIQDDIVAALNASRPGNVPAALNAYTKSLTGETDLPSLIVFPHITKPIKAVPSELEPLIMQKQYITALEIRVRGDSTNGPGTNADPILAWCGKVLNGRRVDQLYYVLLEDETQWHWDQADHSYLMIRMFVAAKTQNKAKDLTAWS